jgi:hypothetical protein
MKAISNSSINCKKATQVHERAYPLGYQDKPSQQGSFLSESVNSKQNEPYVRALHQPEL